MANIKIYNANQIGANYTVISCNGTKVMIDYGQALPGSNVTQEDFDWEKDTVDAVFFTHYHGDHVGRILEIPHKIPLFMGSTTRQIMLNIHRALASVEELRKEQEQYVSLLEDDERIHEFTEGKPCEKIGDIEVIPYSVDHSAYDAYMFLVKTPDENILHTGDFREHGYRGSKMVEVIEKLVLPKAGGHIDTLIIEGTMMERQGELVRREQDLQQEAAERFAENKYAFLVCSSTNLDTLASFHKAALRNDMYTYCYSKYLLGQLETFTKTAGKRSDLYKFDKTYLVDLDKEFTHKYWKEPKTQEKIMREKGFLCIIKPGERYAEWIERFADLKPLVIYALWDGYLDSARDAYNKEWAEFFKPYQDSEQFLELHTSGHATPETIAKIIETVKPGKRIFPMHTGKAEEFKKLPIDEVYKKRMC
ncbi:MAG: MBL fold metallo-hydrolase [Lachnospiraceae bacterium]|nr:MBL fold metallo-hydrolase [Lachnospiraceae bacterium]